MTSEALAFDVASFDLQAAARRERRQTTRNRAVLAAGLVLSLLWIVPFYYLAVSVFKTNAEYGSGNPLALPQSLSPLVENVLDAWSRTKMAYGLFNSALYGLCGAGAAVFLAALAAYGLARIDFRGKTFWFLLIFSGTVFPFQMYLIPLFISYSKLGLVNTRLGMILFYTAICIPFPVLVLRNYMAQLPREMDEAARVDGCSEWRIFRSIVLPNCLRPMMALFLIQFTWVWNDLLFSMVLTSREEVRSVMNGLMVLQGGYAATTPNVVMAATLIASLPTLVLFLALRRFFMEGLKISTL
ncbi:MAG: carbohydrate ABC transporter permease [Methylobacteriaceae bacterium]|nr:carbohydrate ABC transporter permease [Methylobacteriaceae bacterium]